MIKTFLPPGPAVARSITAGAMLLALGACGSGGESPPQQQSTGANADAAASSGVAAFIAFTQNQIANSSESADPRPIQGISAPVSDTTEPAVI